MEHNDVYVDDAELVVVGGGPSEPVIVNPPPVVVAVGAQPTSVPGAGGRITHVVKPGDTLFALALQYGVPVDQIMTLNGLTSESQIQIGHELLIAQAVLQPRAKPTQASPTEVSRETGSGLGAICVQVFEDPEAAGSIHPVNDPAPVRGTHFSVSGGQNNLITERILDGQSSDFCFTDLLAITYRVTADPPPGYLAADQRRWAVALTSDTTVDIRFGIRPDPSVKQSNLWPIAALGAGGLCLAVAGGVGLWKRRRNRYYQ
jgi:LysM repeat protein